MTWTGWAEIALILVIVGASAPLIAAYMARVFAGERTPLSPVIAPVEHGFYAAAGVDPTKGQDWRRYLLAMLAFNAAGFVLLYAILRLQHLLPLNPAGLPALSDHLAFNTAVSFVTNTNWQSYGGETTMSLFSQMAGLTVQNFVSAATGIALALAVVRAFASKGTADLGNFWADLTRTILYVFLPICFVMALAFVALGVPQTLQASASATTIEGAQQTLSMGRLRLSLPSSSLAPMAAASSTSTPPIRSRTRTPGPT